MALPIGSDRHPAAAAPRHTAPWPGLSADASLHPAANLRHKANPARWCFDSACASDRAASEKPHIAPLIAAQPVSEARSAESLPRESPSTSLRRNDVDR